MPLTAVQLLWLNLITNGIQDNALAFEKNSIGLMKEKVRVMQIIIVSVPGAGEFLGIQNMPIVYILGLILTAILVLVVMEIFKLGLNKKAKIHNEKN